MKELNIAAEKALSSCFSVKPDEKILLVFDESTTDIAKAFIDEATRLNLNLKSREIPLTGGHGIEPEKEISLLMTKFDIVIAPTKYSLTHTDAVRNACKAGSRVGTLPGINAAIFSEGLASDPKQLDEIGSFWVSELVGEKQIRITTEKGSDLIFRTGKYQPMNDNGMINQSGSCGNLPAGETFIAPDEFSANGQIVIDGTIGGQEGPDLTSPVKLTLENGSIVDFGESDTTPEGAIRAEKLKQTLLPFREDALVLAEFGIGTNPNLNMSGNLLGDEKLMGTIHLAFGNNCSMGGSNNVKVHIDCLVTEPKIFIDGKLTRLPEPLQPLRG